MSARRATGQRGQGMVEFALTVGLLMLLVVLTWQVAVYLHYRGSLDTAAREGAFQAALVGHSPADGERAANDLWTKLEPGGGAIEVRARQVGNLTVVDARGREPLGLPISAHAVHTVERFEPGSGS